MNWSTLPFIFVVSTVTSPQPFTTMANEQKGRCRCACGGPLVKDFRIVGGTVAEDGEFPWIVWIRLGQKNDDFCAGTLISRRHVLTAAHCLLDMEDVTVLDMFLGKHNVSEAKDPYKATLATIHSGFVDDEDQNLPNDIAIIQLEKSIKFSRKIRAACLPRNNDHGYDSGEATVAGWGVTTENGRPAKELHKVLLPFVPRAKCNETFPGLGESVVCAGYKEGKQDACQGDSGGPLHIINKVGMYELVVSFGEGCARPEMPAVFTRVPYYLDWIKTNLGEDCLCSPSKKLLSRNRSVNDTSTAQHTSVSLVEPVPSYDTPRVTEQMQNTPTETVAQGIGIERS